MDSTASSSSSKASDGVPRSSGRVIKPRIRLIEENTDGSTKRKMQKTEPEERQDEGQRAQDNEEGASNISEPRRSNRVCYPRSDMMDSATPEDQMDVWQEQLKETDGALMDAEKSNKKLRQELDAANAEIRNLRTKQGEFDEERGRFDQRLKEEKSKLLQKEIEVLTLNNKTAELSNRLEQAEREQRTMQTELDKSLSINRARSEEREAAWKTVTTSHERALREQRESYQQHLNDYKEYCQHTESEFVEMEKSKLAAVGRAEKLQVELRATVDERDELEKARTTDANELDRLRKEQAATSAQLAAKSIALEKTRMELEAHKAEMAAHKKQQHEAEKRDQEQQSELRSLQVQLGAAVRERQHAERESDSVYEHLRVANAKCGAMTESCRRLQQELDEERAKKTTTTVKQEEGN